MLPDMCMYSTIRLALVSQKPAHWQNSNCTIMSLLCTLLKKGVVVLKCPVFCACTTVQSTLRGEALIPSRSLTLTRNTRARARPERLKQTKPFCKTNTTKNSVMLASILWVFSIGTWLFALFTIQTRPPPPPLPSLNVHSVFSKPRSFDSPRLGTRIVHSHSTCSQPSPALFADHIVHELPQGQSLYKPIQIVATSGTQEQCRCRLASWNTFTWNAHTRGGQSFT